MATQLELMRASGLVDAEGRLIDNIRSPKIITVELRVAVKSIDYQYGEGPSAQFETRGLRSSQVGGFYDVNFDFNLPLHQVVIKPED